MLKTEAECILKTMFHRYYIKHSVVSENSKLVTKMRWKFLYSATELLRHVYKYQANYVNILDQIVAYVVALCIEAIALSHISLQHHIQSNAYFFRLLFSFWI